MIHIVTGFSRLENRDLYLNGLRLQGVIWHPLHHDELEWPSEPWIQPLYTGPLPEPWPANATLSWKFNKFLERGLVADDYYSFLNDDDWFEGGIYQRINHQSANVIIVSMKRGYRIPGGKGHGTSTLFASKENAKVGSVGLEQIFLKGKALAAQRFNNTICADGEFIEKVCKEHEALYLWDSYVLFNYYEKGRW